MGDWVDLQELWCHYLSSSHNILQTHTRSTDYECSEEKANGGSLVMLMDQRGEKDPPPPPPGLGNEFI